MDTTLKTTYLLTQQLDNNGIESTIAEKNAPEKSSHLTSIVLPALVAGLLVTPIYKIPTNETPDYSIYSHYSKIGQQNEIDFEKSINDIIISYQYLPANWDGYEGIHASSDAIKDTLEFLEQLPFGVAEPRPGLSGDGEVSLFWENDDVFIDIGFLGNEKYTFYARDSQGIEYFKDEIDLRDPIPSALLNLIYIK